MRRSCMRLVCACALVSISAAGAYGQTAEDSAVAQRVASTIKESGQLSNYRLGVKYQDGVAWLLGTVSCEEQKDAAVMLAEQVAGADHVICKLQIDATIAQPALGQMMDGRGTLASFPMARQNQTASQGRDPQVAAAMAHIAPQREMAMAPQRMAPRAGQPMPMSQAQANAVRSASYQQQMAQQQVAQAGCYGPGMMGGGMGGPQAMGHVGGGGAGVNYD